MIWLAAPLALQQAGHHLMGVVDAAMLGRYSDAALAGAGVGNNLYFAITCDRPGHRDGHGHDRAAGARRRAHRRCAARGRRRRPARDPRRARRDAARARVAAAARARRRRSRGRCTRHARSSTCARSACVPFLITVALRCVPGGARHDPAAGDRRRSLGNIVNAALDLVLDLRRRRARHPAVRRDRRGGRRRRSSRS